MGCSVSRLQAGEVPLTPRATAPPPPPLSTLLACATDTAEDCSLALVAGGDSATFGGVGFSSFAQSTEAAHEALIGATAQLAACRGKPPNPSLAILVCGEAAEDAEDVRCEIVRAFPEVRLHGVASVASPLTPHHQSYGNSHSSRKPMRRTGGSAGSVGCLLLEAQEGSFAAAWDDTGDALYAANWLQEQMPHPQAIIMATVPGNEESALESLQSVFPGVPVHGTHLVEATKWVTLSHLGSASRGVSLVGVATHVGFGAAALDAASCEESQKSLAAQLAEAYDAAKVAGNLKTVHAGILTCSRLATHEGGSESLIFDSVKAHCGDVPILGVSCEDQRPKASRLGAQIDPSIGFMLFGERHSESCSVGNEEAESTCAKLQCMDEGPGTPSTASTEIRQSPRLATI